MLLFLPLAHVFGKVIQCGALYTRTVVGHTADVTDLRRRPRRVPADVPARGAAGVREGLQRRAAAGPRRRQGPDLRRGRRHRDRLEPRRRTPAAPGCCSRLRHALFDRLVYGKLRAGGRRHVVRRRVGQRAARRRGSGTSSAVSACRCWRATGSPRPRPAITVNTLGAPADRHASAGRCPGTRVRIADDGEILLPGRSCSAATGSNETATARGDRGRLVPQRRHRRARRRRLPADHRPQEGDHRHRGRQERRARRARGPAARAPAGQPVHGGRRRAAVHRRAGHHRPRGAARLAGAQRQAGRRRRRRPGRRRGAARGDRRRGRRGEQGGVAGRADPRVPHPPGATSPRPAAR